MVIDDDPLVVASDAAAEAALPSEASCAIGSCSGIPLELLPPEHAAETLGMVDKDCLFISNVSGKTVSIHFCLMFVQVLNIVDDSCLESRSKLLFPKSPNFSW